MSQALPNAPVDGSSSQDPDRPSLDDLIRTAVHTLVPILPMNGSPKQGYTVAWDVTLRGREEEIRAAAEAVCALWDGVK